MAAFDPATVRLLREQLRETTAQHNRDLDRLAKFKADSKDQRAVALRERVGEAIRVSRDLETLVPSDDCTPPTELQRAYRVLGHVMETVPTGFTACGWDIEVRYSTGTRIKIQQSITVHSAEAVRQSLRSVAAILGLTYAEERREDRVMVHAVGEIDGISIQIWDAIESRGGESL